MTCTALRGRGRRAGHRAGDLPGMQRQRREAAGRADDPGPDGEHRRLRSLPRRGAHHRHAVRTSAAATAACARSGRCRSSIPAGIDDGQRIALEGQGEAGPRGGPNGDLYVAVKVRAHPRARRGAAPSSTTSCRSRSRRRRSARRLTVPTVEGERGGRGPGRRAVRPGDPAARQGRPAPARRRPRRPARHRQRRRADEALEARARAAPRARRGRASRRCCRRAADRSSIACATCSPEPPQPMRWLELSVEADVEAVEAVSEILGRVGCRHRRAAHPPDSRPRRRARRRARIRRRRTSITAHLAEDAGRVPTRSRPPSARCGTSRPSACGRSARCRSARSTTRTGPTPGSGTTSRSASGGW